MRLASKGLGRVTLPFALDEATIRVDNDELWFTGRIKEKKVNWDYKMKLDDADIVQFIALACDKAIVRFVARNAGVGLFGAVAKQVVKTAGHFLSLRTRALRAPPPSAPPAPPATAAGAGAGAAEEGAVPEA